MSMRNFRKCTLLRLGMDYVNKYRTEVILRERLCCAPGNPAMSYNDIRDEIKWKFRLAM